MTAAVRWLPKPQKQDYQAAEDYLSPILLLRGTGAIPSYPSYPSYPSWRSRSWQRSARSTSSRPSVSSRSSAAGGRAASM